MVTIEPRSLLLLAALSAPLAVSQVGVTLPPPVSPLQGPFSPAAVHRASMEAIAQDPKLVASPYTLLVRFHAGTSESTKASLRGLVGRGKVRAFKLVPDLEVIEVRGLSIQAACDRLAPHVRYAEPDYVARPTATPSDPRFAEQWGLHNSGQVVNGVAGASDADIDAPEAWNAAREAPEFVIAILDTGVDMDHPDLVDNIWTNPDEIAGNGLDDDGNGKVDDVHGWDFFEDDNDPEDVDNDLTDNRPAGHGSHVAGIIGARGNNGIGVSGVLWRCRLMHLRCGPPTGFPYANLIAALEYAVSQGARVSNNSYGHINPVVQSHFDAIQAAGIQGHLFVAAAGNDGADTEVNRHIPSSYELANVLSVAALRSDDGLADFSNFGRTMVDLGAPGESILSAISNGQFGFKRGTSMATPFVTGAAALVWSRNPSFTVAQVRGRLLSRVRAVPSLSGKCVTGGALDLRRAMSPTAPTNVRLRVLSNGLPQISWIPRSQDATSFEVQVISLATGQALLKKKVSGATTSITITSLSTPMSTTVAAAPILLHVSAANAAGSSQGTTVLVNL